MGILAGGTALASTPSATGELSPPFADKIQPRVQHPLLGERAGELRFPTYRLQSGIREERNVTDIPKREGRATSDFDLPELHGCVIGRSDWAKPAVGLYTLPTSEAEEFTLDISGVNAINGGVAIENAYYSTKANDFGSFLFVNVSVYDLETGAVTGGRSTQTPEAVCFDSTYDPSTGKVFAITYNSTKTSYQLTEINYTVNPLTTKGIAQLDGIWNAIAADASGTLYGIRSVLTQHNDAAVCTNSELVKFNKETGEYTVVGLTGQAPEFVSSATIDPATNRMFWA